MVRVIRPSGVVAAYVWDYAGTMELLRYFWDAAVVLDPAAYELDEGRRFPDPSAGGSHRTFHSRRAPRCRGAANRRPHGTATLTTFGSASSAGRARTWLCNVAQRSASRSSKRANSVATAYRDKRRDSSSCARMGSSRVCIIVSQVSFDVRPNQPMQRTCFGGLLPPTPAADGQRYASNPFLDIIYHRAGICCSDSQRGRCFCCFSRLGFIAGAASSADGRRSAISRLTPLGGNGIGARRGLTRTASKIFRCSARLSLDSTLVTWRARWWTRWQ